MIFVFMFVISIKELAAAGIPGRDDVRQVIPCVGTSKERTGRCLVFISLEKLTESFSHF
jgi:hypothetical protein